MDVIALSEAGFEAAVAPLGTAITESQLQMLWRIAPEPIIALDGDTAGLRAAMRLIDLSLPLVEAGQSLRFAMMPEGKDPDDLLKSSGAPALQKLLDEAMPMVRLLWQRETEGRVFDSPERKAALDKALRDKIKTIADPSIRNHYGQEIKELRFQLFRPQRAASGQRRTGGQRTGGGFGKWQPAPVPLQSTKSSALATGTGDAVTHMLRESVILAALITCPQVVESFETPLERLRCINPDNAALRDLILRHAHEGAEVLREKISSARGPEALENLLNASHVAIVPCIRTPGNADMARITVAEELAKLSAARGLDAEIADAAEDLTGVADEGVTWRLSQAAEAADSANRSTQKEGSGDFVTADNGVKMEKDEVTRSRAMFDAIDFSKRGRKQH